MSRWSAADRFSFLVPVDPTANVIGAERPGQTTGRRYHPAEPRRQGWSWIARRAPLAQRRGGRIQTGECPGAGERRSAAALRAG
jgi:hypothetical protein